MKKYIGLGVLTVLAVATVLFANSVVNPKKQQIGKATSDLDEAVRVIPEYPGAKWKNVPTEGVAVSRYATSSADIKALSSWYSMYFESTGWNVVSADDSNSTFDKYFSLEKGNIDLDISFVKEEENEPVIITMTLRLKNIPPPTFEESIQRGVDFSDQIGN